MLTEADLSRYDKQQFLTGLRGKDRAKMLYALQQSRIELDHTMALFDHHCRSIQPTLSTYIESKNAQIIEATTQIKALLDGFYDGLAPILAPYELDRFPAHADLARLSVARELRDTATLVPNYNAHAQTARNILDSAGYFLESSTQETLRAALLDYRRTLGAPKPPKNTLTPKEKADITQLISTVKALPPTTPNAAGEIEVQGDPQGDALPVQ